MATFEVTGGNFEEITEPRLLDPGVYAVRLAEPPRTEQNKAETGYNVVLQLTTFGEADPLNNGRTFPFWLPLPNPTDEGRMTRNGQPLADWKLDRIKTIVENLGGEVEGMWFTIPDDAMARVQIDSKMGDNGPYNQITGEILPYNE